MKRIASPATLFSREAHITLSETEGRHGRSNVGRRVARSERRHRPVDQDVAEIVEQLLCSILRRQELEQLRILVNKVSVNVASQELRMTQNIHQERRICLHSKEKNISDIT